MYFRWVPSVSLLVKTAVLGTRKLQQIRILIALGNVTVHTKNDSKNIARLKSLKTSTGSTMQEKYSQNVVNIKHWLRVFTRQKEERSKYCHECHVVKNVSFHIC